MLTMGFTLAREILRCALNDVLTLSPRPYPITPKALSSPQPNPKFYLMQTLDQYNFAGKRAVVRVDFNVPLAKDFTITDDTRIRAATPSIQKILADGGSVVLLSHLGRPKDGPEDKFSLRHIVSRLSQEYGQQVQFADDALKAEEQAKNLKPGQVLLVENVRFL